METREAAETAVLDPNPMIDGRKANVNLAYLGVKSRIVATAGKKQRVKYCISCLILYINFLYRYDPSSSKIPVASNAVCLWVILNKNLK